MHSIKIDFENIEMDFHGLYIYLGAIGLLLITIFYLLIIWKGIKLMKEKTFTNYFVVIIILILCGAFLGGHVLYESTTLFYLMPLCALISSNYNLKKRGKLNYENYYFLLTSISYNSRKR